MLNNFKQLVKKSFLAFGIEISKKPKIPIKFFETDDDFNQRYMLGQEKTQMTSNTPRTNEENSITAPLFLLISHCPHICHDQQ
jgi:hypothetical protein